MRSITIRPVEEQDKNDLAKLYAQLDSCNANSDTVDTAINSTQAIVKGLVGDGLTLLAQDTKTGQVLASGSLIWQNEVQMYEPNLDGLELSKTTGKILEFGSMIVAPEARGQGIGRALSEVRARFAQILEADWLLAEFLPEYLNPQKKNTFFWQEEILPALKASGKLTGLQEACSDILKKPIKGSSDLLLAMATQLSTQDRNKLITEFFPQTLLASYYGSIGKHTTPALHNLQAIYQDQFELAGYFPIDGGQNYIAPGNTPPKLKIPLKSNGLSFTTTLPTQTPLEALNLPQSA
jgi:GNAT superfamily N-acetyltransferase